MSPGSRLRRDSCWWNSRDHADLFSIQLFRSSANQGHGVSAVWASTTRRKSCCSRHGTFSAVSWAREPRAADTTYNLACLAVRRGRRDEAFSLLREAMQHGLSPAQALGIETDPDLKALHEDARFAAIIARGEAACCRSAKSKLASFHAARLFSAISFRVGCHPDRNEWSRKSRELLGSDVWRGRKIAVF